VRESKKALARRENNTVHKVAKSSNLSDFKEGEEQKWGVKVRARSTGRKKR
jgi:hypothetical protein